MTANHGPSTDISIYSGSHDGTVRFWRCTSSFRALEPLPQLDVKLEGFVNALAFSPDGSALVACVGRTHRLGGWWKLKGKDAPRNRVVVIPLRKEKEEEEDMEM